jgi:hypothetical protein
MHVWIPCSKVCQKLPRVALPLRQRGLALLGSASGCSIVLPQCLSHLQKEEGSASSNFQASKLLNQTGYSMWYRLLLWGDACAMRLVPVTLWLMITCRREAGTEAQSHTLCDSTATLNPYCLVFTQHTGIRAGAVPSTECTGQAHAHLHEAVILLLPCYPDGPFHGIPGRAVHGRVQAEGLLTPVCGTCRVWRC